MRVGAGLDADRRVISPVPEKWQYIFVEDNSHIPPNPLLPTLPPSDGEWTKNPNAEWEPSISLPPVQRPPGHGTPCDPDDERVFHIYWTGAFTDKPYMTILSFLFTQNTALHLSDYEDDHVFCRPKLWVWLYPSAKDTAKNMFDQLQSNPWSSPFLRPRFQRVVQFKLWNITEQLDSLPELKDDWRNVGTPLKSFGSSPADTESTHHSVSSEDYDKVSVIMSDMVRFVLCQRFGGVYLDADMLFLRDWEELWGWKGSYSYRWSARARYNTAVLRLRKGSALGTFLLRTALKNGLDFHPIVVSRYLKEAHLDGLLYRIPDALFDPAWLNADGYQKDRPPQPYFQSYATYFYSPTLIDI